MDDEDNISIENALSHYLKENDGIKWYNPAVEEEGSEWVDVFFHPQPMGWNWVYDIVTKNFAEFQHKEDKIKYKYNSYDQKPTPMWEVDHIIVLSGNDGIWERPESEINNAIKERTKELTGKDINYIEKIDASEAYEHNEMLSEVEDRVEDIEEEEIDTEELEDLTSDIFNPEEHEPKDINKIKEQIEIAKLNLEYYDMANHYLTNKDLEKAKESDEVPEKFDDVIEKMVDFKEKYDG